jgi:CSLREA domain-containing protein
MVVVVAALAALAGPGCILFGVAALPCKVDAACAPGDRCVDGRCAPSSATGEGEGVGEGEGAGEGEGEGAGEGEGGEGEGAGEGEGEGAGEGEGEGAPDYVVNTINDDSDANPGDDVCATTTGDCSLRAAIEEASTHTTRSISLPSGVVPLLTDEIPVSNASSIVIIDGGAGALSSSSSITPAPGRRFFHVNGGVLHVANLSLAHAALSAGDGGAILVDNGGNLGLDNVSFNQCSTVNGDGGAIAISGGSAIVTVSSFTSSLAGGAGLGGAIAVAAGSSLDVTLSLFDENTTANLGGAIEDDGTMSVTTTLFETNHSDGFGGALNIDCNAVQPAPFVNDAFFDNTSGSGSVLAGCEGSPLAVGMVFSSIRVASTEPTVFDFDGNLTLAAVVIEASSAPVDVGAPGPCTSLGDNVVHTTATSGDVCSFGATGDVTADPQLAAPANNGGPFPSMSIGSSSPAIDHAQGVGCPSTDQRGLPRPVGAGCDSGSFEVQ